MQIMMSVLKVTTFARTFAETSWAHTNALVRLDTHFETNMCAKTSTSVMLGSIYVAINLEQHVIIRMVPMSVSVQTDTKQTIRDLHA